MPILLIVNIYIFFFFNDTATTEIYTLSLHDALPISGIPFFRISDMLGKRIVTLPFSDYCDPLVSDRSEEHTSELQSQSNLVCRLLLEKKIYELCIATPVRLPSAPCGHSLLSRAASRS